jgi:hypothetical protein
VYFNVFDHRFQFMAYLLAGVWISLCLYFNLLIGVAFSSEVASAWMLGFTISLIQDLFVMEFIKLCSETGIKMVVKPQIAAFIASSIVARVKIPSGKE